MTTLIITEKTSQARDLRAALGDRIGQILPAEGHLLRLAEPHEVEASWKSWASVLLKPQGLYPTKPSSQGNKPAKLKAIAAALKTCDEVILATDCDREGQLIGQQILEHFGYRGTVRRALFTAQDPKSLRQAFDRLKPNQELHPLYEAAVARQQSDQIFNLSLTRTATRTLLAYGTKGVIGIGRVKTPTLAIVCLRELEIRDFKVEDYFEVVTNAKVADGTFVMRYAPPVKSRIKDRDLADAIVQAATKFTGPLSVSVENRRQAPPRLFDLPSLQKTCGQRWGWTADKTLSIAQELYDGSGKQLITYPRAEARHLAENQIDDVPVIVAAMTGLRGFAHLRIDPPVIRKGKAGHFSDKALEGVSHHAVVPNVNVMDNLEQRIARLSDDEKRLFALVCRSYLAAVMPDYEYRQTTITMAVPVPGRAEIKSAKFRAVGRIPLKPGWKAAFGTIDPDESMKKPEKEAEQTLPQLADGDPATLSRARVQSKKTQPPPRYNEGTLIDAMQNAWRFIQDETLRDRLKEAKGIGTPATRAGILMGLKHQNLLTAQGKHIVPTPAGLQLFELLRSAVPTVVDPGTTAIWEMRLDDVVLGKAHFRAVIDEISVEAERLIAALRRYDGGKVELGGPASGSRKTSSGRLKSKKKSGASNGAWAEAAKQTHAGHNAKPPTEKMIAFAERIAKDRQAKLPKGYNRSFDVCRRFLDEHVGGSTLASN
jgi:DNA topoisomerase-3